MHKQCISGVFITLLFAMVAPSYAVDDSMVPKELEDAMKSCRDSAQGSVESFDSCMEKKGFDEKPQSSVPAPSKEVDEQLKSAVKDCHETSSGNLPAFENCMEQKGFNKPRIEAPD